MNAHYHIGTCAWSFDEWRGVFYPGGAPDNRRLAFYARVFGAVEIDSTFYAPPPATTVGHWLSETPGHFRFACKAPRTITHERRLRGCGGMLGEFLASMQPLHARMGPVLLQMPPSFSPEADGMALRDFVKELPHGWRYAIEFRDEAWHQPRFAKLLEDHGICWAWSDRSPLAEQNRAPFGFLPETADFLYLRLMGDLRTKYGPDGKETHRYGRVLWSREQAIDSWAVRLQRLPEHMRNIYVMCNNHYEGFGPETCRRLGARLGLEFAVPHGGEHRGAKQRQMELFGE